MSAAGRLDPDLLAPFQRFPLGRSNLHDIPQARAIAEEMIAALKAQSSAFEGVITEDRQVPGPDGAPEVAVRIYQPTERPATLPALLWIHGGGYVRGSVEEHDLYVKQLVKAVKCVAVSVEYRLAPEHPFPAPLEDCYAALTWLVTHAADLGVDPQRVAVGGGSAGGGLAAGLALLTRDRADVHETFQLLIYPMLDDRNVTQAGETVPDTIVWSRENNLIGWRAYLGREPGGDDVSSYAAAIRASDLVGLPPAYIAVGELDLFLNENFVLAQRPLAAGVSTELQSILGSTMASTSSRLPPMSPNASLQIATTF